MTAASLTPTQHAILSHALAHADGRVEWFPSNIHGGARQKVLAGLTAQLLERARANFVLHFARLGVAIQHGAQPLDELLVAVGLVECHEAVSLHRGRILLTCLELIDQADQICASRRGVGMRN